MREMVLIKNSEAAKDKEIYGNLYFVLQGCDDTLSERDIKNNKSFDKKSLAVLRDGRIKKILIENIKQEWKPDKFYEDNDKKTLCQLCRTSIKKVYYIKNRINGNELNVGSECVKDYLDGSELKLVRNKFNEKNNLRKQEIRRVKFAELEVEDPEFVTKARKKFINLNIVPPYSLYCNIDQNLHDLNFIKTDYIKNDGDFEEITKKYNLLKTKYLEYWSQAEEHYKSHCRNKLACKKYISDWLKEKHYNIWENVSKNNGLFNEETLKYAYQDRYVKAHLSVFSKHLKDDKLKIMDVTGTFIRFSINNLTYRQPVYFLISNKIFMKNIGCYCLTKEDFFFNSDNLTDIKIENQSKNINALFERMSIPMKKADLSLEFGSYSSQIYYKRLPRELKKSRLSERKKLCEVGYKKVKVESYAYICSHLLFKSDKEIENEFRLILHKLESGQGWLTQKELEEQELIAKDLSFKKQKEFINYV